MSKVEQDNFEIDIEQDNESKLDISLVISIFQEKLSTLMTELVIKEATIKHQSNIIRKLKGQ
jgi:hypothetical protein